MNFEDILFTDPVLSGHAHREDPAESLQEQSSDPDRRSAAIVGSVVEINNNDHQ